MKAEYHVNEHAWHVEIDTDMDMYTIPGIKQLLLDNLEQKSGDLVLDCTKVSYIDSIGLGMLVSVLNHVLAKEGNVTIRGLKPHLRKIFAITGLDTTFRLEA